MEERQFGTAENIKRYLAVDDVVAWRILYLTMLGRETPTLRQATRWIAKLGGFLGRKGDGDPGVTVL